MNRRAEAVISLQARLGHTFGDPALLERALTHSSANQGAVKLADNERLEFLGDRVLNLVVAEALVLRDPQATAGDLSKRLAGLVNRGACARVARQLGLGEALRLNGAASRQGARDQDTFLADGCEALIAALYLELGLGPTADLVLAHWDPLMDEPIDRFAANPKSELQEWAAAEGLEGPRYRLASRNGPDHQPTFVVEVAVGENGPATGIGSSLQAAEKAAALNLLLRRWGAA